MVEYSQISEDEWQQLPDQQQKQPDLWEPLMRDLSQGKIASLSYSDAKERRKIRLGIARRATSWGFKTETRYTESHVAVRRTDRPALAPPAEPQERRARRRKEPA